jgi:hypothetical protein
MSRKTIRICDRCGETIENGGSILKAEAGELRKPLGEELDLCTRCGDRFLEFMQGERIVRQGPPGEAPGASVDRKSQVARQSL